VSAGGVPITSLASLVRSKNAGPFVISLDFVFPDHETFARVRDSGAVSRDSVAALYGLAPERVSDVIEYPAANALKVNIARESAAGGFGERDLYGSQQGAILDRLIVPTSEHQPGS
jgi:Domain of unknown function (DUF4387)